MRKEDFYRDFVLDPLRSLEGLVCRAMFGGYGLYLGPDFIGILHGGPLYFKTDEATRERYRSRGMAPFAPSEKQVLKSYYEVPGEIVEDDEQLVSWAREPQRRQGGENPRQRENDEPLRRQRVKARISSLRSGYSRSSSSREGMEKSAKSNPGTTKQTTRV